MKKLPISIQTFQNIIEGEMIYVDKTKFIHKLVNEGKYYFFARPRRFGKSLLLTTLKSFFEGKKDLFEGLFIYDKETEWKKYPMIHIDYSLVSYKDSKAIFQESLLEHLYGIALGYQIILKSKIISNAFTELVEVLHEKYGKVVVLVDEYDKPMVDKLNDDVRFAENREVLSNLYGAMKGLDKYFRFVMLTGVSRFAKMNVFSGMNNLTDISMSEEYSTIVGFTQAELESYFGEWLESVRQKYNISATVFMDEVQRMYNGFSWDGVNKLYNPFSILSFVTDKTFLNYWFSSGTPTFLIDLIKKQKKLPETFEGTKALDLVGSTMAIEKLPIVPILFQTGYLTIQRIEYQGFKHIYHLNYPNAEVRESFIRYIAASFVDKNEYELQPEAIRLREALYNEETDKFIQYLQSFLSDIPYQLHIPAEAYYHSLIYMMLRLVGVQLILEKSTDKGRIDAVLELDDKIYIIEFKFAKNTKIKKIQTLSRQAIKQIEDNKYYESYLSSSKKIILFGVGYLDKKLDSKVKILND